MGAPDVNPLRRYLKYTSLKEIWEKCSGQREVLSLLVVGTEGKPEVSEGAMRSDIR